MHIVYSEFCEHHLQITLSLDYLFHVFYPVQYILCVIFSMHIMLPVILHKDIHYKAKSHISVFETRYHVLLMLIPI